MEHKNIPQICIKRWMTPTPLMWVYPKTCVRHVQKEKEQNYGDSRMYVFNHEQRI